MIGIKDGDRSEWVKKVYWKDNIVLKTNGKIL